jgi:hypothetical protein
MYIPVHKAICIILPVTGLLTHVNKFLLCVSVLVSK